MQLGHILFGLVKAMRRRKPAPSPVKAASKAPTVQVVIDTSAKQRWAIQLPDRRLFGASAHTKSEARAAVKRMTGLARLPVGTVIKRCLVGQA